MLAATLWKCMCVLVLKMKNFQLFFMYIYIPTNPPYFLFTQQFLSSPPLPPLLSQPTELNGLCHVKALKGKIMLFHFITKTKDSLRLQMLLSHSKWFSSATAAAELKMHHVIIWFFNCLPSCLLACMLSTSYTTSFDFETVKNYMSWLTICISTAVDAEHRAKEKFLHYEYNFSRSSRFSCAKSFLCGVCCELHLWQKNLFKHYPGIFNEVI